jgi:curli biogenesis system outer membrane secretion channel CsgG
MKKIVLAVAMVLMLGSYAGTKNNGLSLQEAINQCADQMAKELPKGSRAVVVAFDSENAKLSNYIMEELTGELRTRGIETVDRKNLEHIFRELNFQQTDYVDERTALSIGKIAGANIVITGGLVNLNTMYRYQASAINVATAVRVSIARFDVRNDRAMKRLAGEGK